jgi:hypothetical protein
MEELATRAEFQDDEVILLRLVEFDKLYDVGMIQLSHYLDLFQYIRPLHKLVNQSVQRVVNDQQSRLEICVENQQMER